jgi:itaconyl-CoA hydratase
VTSRYFEDFAVGDRYRSELGRTVTEADNIWFSALTMNTNQIHFNDAFAAETTWRRPLMNSTFTLALVTGLTTADTSQNGGVNLEWSEIKLPNPVFAGDTIWAESEILSTRASESRPGFGIVAMRCRGINQRGEVVCEFRRTFMIPRRDAAPPDGYPGTDAEWTV